jgi:NADH-quinone oxidoreductase subunit L
MMLLVALLVPLIGAILWWALGPWLGRATGWLATIAVAISFVATLLTGTHAHQAIFTWMPGFSFGLMMDPLSYLWALIVSGVGCAITLYSIGYMHGDRAFPRFFAYMNFFIFAMLLLVLSDNWVGLLVGWGNVGLASYFLIGYWFERPTAVAAAQKAFVMNVVGDVGMMFAIFLIVMTVHSIDYHTTFAASASFSAPLLYAICFGLFVGAIAKSAQVPLHTWLPDAMEGPTPVSALIHAATMVTAGVYLVARSAPLWDKSPGAQMLVGTIGALTAIAAAILGAANWDIKRVLAYSTMSQIGYMIAGVGVGAYTGGIAHFFTHAFFKAQLFLASGLIIHGLNNEQDLRKMGGLAKRMPLAFWAILTGVLAISGVPGFSGFFSKDQIIQGALDHGHPWIYGVLLVTAGITAYYMFRLFFLAFLGDYRGDASPSNAQEHGEAPAWIMGAPVALLIVPTVIAGWLMFSPTAAPSLWDRFFSSQFAAPVLTPAAVPEWVTSLIAFGLLLAGFGVAALRYATAAAQENAVARLRLESERMPKVLVKRYYMDSLINAVVVGSARFFGALFDRIVDPQLLDGIVRGFASTARSIGESVRSLQAGLLRAYALIIALGAGCFLVYYFLAGGAR